MKTRILLMLNGGVALAIVAWVIGSLQGDQAESFASASEQVSAHAPIARQSSQTESIDAHPLFNATRLPVLVETPPEDVGTATVQAPPTLVGILRDGDGRGGCLLEDPQSGTKKFLRHGDSYLGWTLTALHGKTAVLRSNAQETEIQLSFDARSPGSRGNTDSIQTNP